MAIDPMRVDLVTLSLCNITLDNSQLLLMGWNVFESHVCITLPSMVTGQAVLNLHS